MIVAVADTHAALWYLFKNDRLSATAKNTIETAALTRRKIAVAPISLAEVVYLEEKGRVVPQTYDYLKQALANPDHVFIEARFSVEVVEAMKQVPRDDVPDMPDRIVAATAVFLGVPIISRDGKIRGSGLRTIW